MNFHRTPPGPDVRRRHSLRSGCHSPDAETALSLRKRGPEQRQRGHLDQRSWRERQIGFSRFSRGCIGRAIAFLRLCLVRTLLFHRRRQYHDAVEAHPGWRLGHDSARLSLRSHAHARAGLPLHPAPQCHPHSALHEHRRRAAEKARLPRPARDFQPSQRSRGPRRPAHARFCHEEIQPLSFEVIKDIAETEGASQAASLQHRTVYLADIGMLSP